MTFEEYYQWMGFSEYPFGVFTSEAEKERLGELYFKPPNYSVILEGLRNTSAIVVGERGTGKTALSLDIEEDLKSDSSLLVRVEDFSPLEEQYSTEDLYEFIVGCVASQFFMELAGRPFSLWGLTKDERIDLSFYLHEYLTSTSKNQLRRKISKVQNGSVKRVAFGAYNFGRRMLNYGVSAAVHVTNDLISKHFSSLPPVDIGVSDYFKELEVEVDDSFTPADRQYQYLERLCDLVNKSGFNKIYLVMDKIDEDPRFDNDADVVSRFIQKIAADNKIITSGLFHMLMFFWSTPFNYIKHHVRTQKITFQELQWSAKDLEKVADKRVFSFSNGTVGAMNDLFSDCSKESVDDLLFMANRNPRDLWHLLNKSISAQYEMDSSRKITDAAVQEGVRRFVTEFNYYEYYPKKSGSRKNTMDVYAYIKHLQKLDGPKFTKNRLNELAGTGSSTSNYVVGMERMGLVCKTPEKEGAAVVYEIKDPKVVYAMENGIAIEG